MVYRKCLRTQSAALKREAAIKALTRIAKGKLIANSRMKPLKAAAGPQN
jgi:predicted GIY-YIG superfamily endonuclease